MLYKIEGLILALFASNRDLKRYFDASPNDDTTDANLISTSSATMPLTRKAGRLLYRSLSSFPFAFRSRARKRYSLFRLCLLSRPLNPSVLAPLSLSLRCNCRSLLPSASDHAHCETLHAIMQLRIPIRAAGCAFLDCIIFNILKCSLFNHIRRVKTLLAYD